MQTVAIRCPQGIARLCELGESVARSGDWNRPDAREALIGLWLSCQLARAELRDTLEVIDNRAQADTRAELTGDAKILDDALVAVWSQLEVDAKALGSVPVDSLEINVELKSETGAIPLAIGVVVGVAIIAYSASVGYVGTKAVEVFDRFLMRWDQKDERAKEIQEITGYVQKRVELQKAVIAAGGDPSTVPLDPIARQRTEDIGKRRMIATANDTARPVESSVFDKLFSGENLALGAAAVLGLLWLARGK